MKINITGEEMIQSPHIYMQAAGSTGNDGTAEGFHLRWQLMNNLGDNHLPKGNLSSTSHGYNRSGDFVKLYKVPYQVKYATTINVAQDIPENIVAAGDDRIWIYSQTNNGVVVYLHFRNHVAYDAISLDPNDDPSAFLAAYGEELLEVEVKDELFFAAEIVVENEVSTSEIKAETISVTEQTIEEDKKFISSRKVFNAEAITNFISEDGNSLLLAQNQDFILTETSDNILLQAGNPHGSNLLQNGSFEDGNVGFESELTYTTGRLVGSYCIIEDAHNYDSNWHALARLGQKFMIVDGATTAGKVIWKQQGIAVQQNTDYVFSAWATSVYPSNPANLKIHVLWEQTQTEDVIPFNLAGQDVARWKNIQDTVNSDANNSVTIYITNDQLNEIGNDFGLDNLEFYTADFAPFSGVRLEAENMSSFRFTLKDALLSQIKIETYNKFYHGVNDAELWQQVGSYSLTTDDTTAFTRLENTSLFSLSNWPKFNGTAKVKTQNYKDRWSATGGLKAGVTEFIDLTNDTLANPKANTQLQEDGQTQELLKIDVSYLDMLNIAATDFHVARMLGLGAIDAQASIDDNLQYVYIVHYVTEADLLDGGGARRVEHFFLSSPLAKIVEKLPEAIALKPVEYGLQVNAGSETINLTDAAGYTKDGRTRYIRLYANQIVNDLQLGEFFASSLEFTLIGKTDAVSLGIEYKKDGDSDWKTPELVNDNLFTDTNGDYEAVPIFLPNPDYDTSIYNHQEKESGIHHYSAYSVNWFSRASSIHAAYVSTNETEFLSPNLVLPPSELKVQLVQKESPRYFTTQAEQDLYDAIVGTDKTLLRVTFNYSHVHDMAYSHRDDATGQWKFGEKIQFFYRENKPRSVKGMMVSVSDDTSDNTLSVVRTKSYVQTSDGVTVSPQIESSLYGNYIGGVLVIGEKKFIISSVTSSAVVGEGPIFKVAKIKTLSPSGSEVNGENDEDSNSMVATYTAPDSTIGLIVTAIENMAAVSNWHDGSTSGGALPNKITQQEVSIGSSGWNTTQEDILLDSGETESFHLRGIWDYATISKELEEIDNPTPGGSPTIMQHLGLYKITFDSYALPQHVQSTESSPVFWYNGIVRVPRESESDGHSPVKDKKVLQVVATENIGTSNNLVLYAQDPSFDSNQPSGDEVKIGSSFKVNYYPGYKTYLFVENAASFDAAHILPAEDEGMKYTYFSARTKAPFQQYYSPMAEPQIVFARELREPVIPGKPLGPNYATRPDFHNKSTYTFTLEFPLKPNAIAVYRAGERMLLNALYSPTTVQAIVDALPHRTEDEYYTSRWNDFVDFFNGITTAPVGQTHFAEFPLGSSVYKFPNPDKAGLFDGTKEAGDVLIYTKAREEFFAAYTPIIEQPILYKYIKGIAYTPINKKQVLRDNAGNVLLPTDARFDAAPMAKIVGNKKIQFTDFSLEGAADDAYFYMAREVSAQMKLSEPSAVTGPIQLINAAPAVEPKVIKVMTQIANPVAENLDEQKHKVKFELNPYPEVEKIKKFEIYRSTSSVQALTPRSMQLIKTIEIDETVFTDNTIHLQDDFAGEEFLPFGDPLFYRIVALRELKYEQDAQLITDYAPSVPSKLMLANLVDNINPEAPDLRTRGDISVDETQYENVVLSWKKTVHNGIYRIYKMNDSGNWVKIGEIVRNNNLNVEFALTDVLDRFDEDENAIYHRFKVDVENSSGLLNLTEKSITVVTGANDILQQLKDIVSYHDTVLTAAPLASMIVDPTNEYVGTMTFKDVAGVMPLGHEFNRIEITVTDSLDNTFTKTISTREAEVSFTQSDGLQLNSSVLNINYTVKVKLFTDIATEGVSWNYTLQYGPVNALLELTDIVDYEDSEQTLHPLSSQSVDQGVSYPGTITITDILTVPSGQTYTKTEVTVADDLGNSQMLEINAAAGNVVFDGTTAPDLELDDTNPNRVYSVTAKVFTDKVPEGFEYAYFLSYVYDARTVLFELTDIISFSDNDGHTFAVLEDESIDSTNAGGSITITDITSAVDPLPDSHVFVSMDVTIADDLGNSQTLTINTAGGNVVFDSSSAPDLELDSSSPNRVYNIVVTLFTNKATQGASFFYNVAYIFDTSAVLQDLISVISLSDNSGNTYNPMENEEVDSPHPNGSITIEDVSVIPLPDSHVFDNMHVTIQDDLANSQMLLISSAGGSVTFDSSSAPDLVLDNSNPNRIYTISVKLITDLAPQGAVFVYTASYIYNQSQPLLAMTDIIALTDNASNTISPLEDEEIESSNPNGSITIADITVDPLPDNNVFDHLDITIQDDLGDSQTLTIATLGGDVTFDASTAPDLELDDTNPNRLYSVIATLFTDKVPQGVSFVYSVAYVYNSADSLLNLTDIVGFEDNISNSFDPLENEVIDSPHPNGSITITDVTSTTLPEGQTFDRMDIIIDDDLGNTQLLTINTQGGSVIFDSSSAPDLILDGSNPNRLYNIVVTLYTDITTQGATFYYNISYEG